MDRRGTAEVPDGQPISGAWDHASEKLAKVQIATDSLRHRLQVLADNYSAQRSVMMDEYSNRINQILDDSTASETTEVISRVARIGTGI